LLDGNEDAIRLAFGLPHDALRAFAQLRLQVILPHAHQTYAVGKRFNIQNPKISEAENVGNSVKVDMEG
jgi:hypothetical protein